MKFRWLLGLMVMPMLVACGNSPSPAVPTATVAPAINVTTAAPNQPAPTAAPPTAVPPTKAAPPATPAPVPTETAPAQPTTAAPAATDTLAATSTTAATIAPTATKPRPTATSSGPLVVTIYVADCHSAPTADKPGRVVVKISAEASGGNGKYRYYYLDKESPTKFIEVVGEKGTRAIGEVRVTSGDGQELKKAFDIGIGGLSCP
jgi:hypothetical protein